MLVQSDAIHVPPQIDSERLNLCICVRIMKQAGRGRWPRASDGCACSDKIVQLAQNLRGHLDRGWENKEPIGHASREIVAAIDVDASIGRDARVVKEDIGVQIVVVVTARRRGLQSAAPEGHG